MKKGRRGYRCVLTSQQSGRQYEFASSQTASIFLGRQRTYVSTCVYKGFPLRHKYTGESFTCEYPNVLRQVKKPKNFTVQPCCTCCKAIGGCSWSRDFEPVKGWEAIPTIIHQSNSADIHSYAILQCPEYEVG